ncbi:MAG: hypothetical protein CHACPFDD_00074 [Phycisphaerae bacterium]|nr:hypothetical protein [Phycisphaerae bacterium]
MGLSSGPASFQRFRIDGTIGGDVTDRFIEQVNGRTFGRLAALSDGTQVGWIGPGHLFQTELEARAIAIGRYAHFALRVERNRVPPLIARSYVRLEEEAALAACGREFLTRSEKRLARQAAAARIEQEARSGAHRRAAVYPLLIDLDAPIVYLCSLSKAAGDVLIQLFSDTFGRALDPLDARRLAERCLLPAHDRALENLRPSRFSDPPSGSEDGEGERDSSEILGPEFLAWLWYQTELDDEPLRLRGGDEILVAIDRTLRLRCPYDLTGTTTITADTPTALPEARAAARGGKLPTRAGLVLGGPAGEFRFVTDAARFTISGMNIPEPQEPRDARQALEHRFDAIVDAAAMLDAVYELFLRARISSQWAATTRAMREWLSGRPALRTMAGA